jgi:hypothetical protein
MAGSSGAIPLDRRSARTLTYKKGRTKRKITRKSNAKRTHPKLLAIIIVFEENFTLRSVEVILIETFVGKILLLKNRGILSINPMEK